MPAFKSSDTVIPVEVLIKIIAHLGPEDDGPTLARLARCSLACHELAIPILYSHIHLYTDRQITRLLSNLSLETDADGKALPCATLTAIPIARREGTQQGKATRKLSQFLFVRHVSLHFVPSPSAIPFGHTSSYDFLPAVWIQGAQGEAENVGLNLFPRVVGIALGRGFMSALAATITVDVPCEDPTHNVTHIDPDREWVDRFAPPRFKQALNGIAKLVPVFRSRYFVTFCCWNLDDIPSGMCEMAKRELVHALIHNDTWGYSYILCTHSTFPQTKLDPWTRIRRHWRHYITVDDSHDQDDDDINDKLLQALAEDVYAIAGETLNSTAYGDKPRRRNMIYAGLSEKQVRRVEQEFVKIVRAKFAKGDRVIVDPSLYDADYNRRNHNLYGDGGSDPEDDDAVREHQKRVTMFDFFREKETAKCEVCGVGEGRVSKLYRQLEEHAGW